MTAARTACLLACFGCLAACSSSPAPAPLPEPLANAREMNELGLASFQAGRYRAALGSFQRAERFFLSIDDAHGAALTAISQAEIHLLLGERDKAAASLERVDVAGPADTQIAARMKLLDARLLSGRDPAGARRALETLQDAPPPVALQARLLLCELELDAGDTACASRLESGDALASARIAQLQARAALISGDVERARESIDRALATYRALAYRPGIASARQASAEVAMRAGNRAAAKEHLEHALYLRLWIHDRVHAAQVLGELEQLADDKAARERYRQWQEQLLDESEANWDEVLLEIVRQP